MENSLQILETLYNNIVMKWIIIVLVLSMIVL